MIELLKFDRKQLRSVMNTLKNEKFLKVIMRVETDAEGRMTRHNYYYINYLMFVNVVKYKLDHVRRKIEMEERDNTSRASFRCESCEKSFTDLEADQLFDFTDGTFKCFICHNEVQEDESATQKKDARTLLARFNEQIHPIYELLQECEDVKLAPELLEPEPTDIKKARERRGNKSANPGEKTVWSGDATRNKTWGYTDTSVTISVNQEEKVEKEAPKDQPVWMTQSTVDGVSEVNNTNATPAASKRQTSGRSDMTNEIETLLLVHEKKSSAAPISGILPDPEESESSDSEAETSKPSKQTSASAAVEEMESEEEEEEVVMATVGGVKVPLNDVTEEMVARMSLDERAEYIRLGQEMYSNMYE